MPHRVRGSVRIWRLAWRAVHVISLSVIRFRIQITLTQLSLVVFRFAKFADDRNTQLTSFQYFSV